MKSTIMIWFLVLLLPLGLSAQETVENFCVTCHADLEVRLSAPVELVQKSVHHVASLSCAGCHGGDPSQSDPDLAMSRGKGFIGKPKSGQIPKLCAKCHSDVKFMRNYNPNLPIDQYELYVTSQHGQLWSKGDSKVATCTSCHTSHNIRKGNDPMAPNYPTQVADRCAACHADPQYMKPYGIATDQLSEYKKSIHAQKLYQENDTSAPTCNDCHGNHGAMPPGISSISNVCGTCHLVQSEYFSSSPHKPAFTREHISECEVCHGNHAISPAKDTLLGTTEPAICVQCHDQDSRGYQAAKGMRNGIDSLRTAITTADSFMTTAQKAGVAIKDEKLSLPNSKDALVLARALVHTFNSKKVQAVIEKGTLAALEAKFIGQTALLEVNKRRQMLVVMVALTFLVALLLVLYIKKQGHEQG